MKEVCKFRIPEEFASKLFKPDEGRSIGASVRRVTLRTDDPRFAKIGSIQDETRRAKGRSFFYGWKIHRTYLKSELADAEFFQLKIIKLFEPAGEECGIRGQVNISAGFGSCCKNEYSSLVEQN